MSFLALAVVALTAAPHFINGFQFPRNPLTHHASFSKTSLKMSMRPTFESLSAKIGGKFGLQRTDFTETFQGQTWQCPNTGVSGTAEWLSESSPMFLTGVSMCTRVNNDGTNEELTLNIWMGPSYDVPHMLLSFGEQANGQYSVTADYVVRGSNPIGSDPQYLEAYYGDEVANAWTTAYQLPGATALPPHPAFGLRLLDSPVRIALGNLDKTNADAIANAHVDRFLAWLDTAQPVMARLRGSFNMRDDKLRQYFYRGQAIKNVAEFGDSLGQTIAAVNTGPTAEAYVGGGS